MCDVGAAVARLQCVSFNEGGSVMIDGEDDCTRGLKHYSRARD